MKKCLILGGGISGLACAAYLAKSHHSIELIEASPKLGGRAYSYFDSTIEDVVDNGQHIMMGCYYNTLEFIDIIGAAKEIDIQKNLTVKFVKKGGEMFELATHSDIYPLNLIRALTGFKALSIKDRMKVVDFFMDLYYADAEDLIDITVEDWFVEKHQNGEIRKSLWDILIVSTMNTTADKASAYLFASILKSIFLDGNEASKIILPKVGLSEMYVEHAENYILQNSGSISKSERVVNLNIKENKISEVVTSKKTYSDFDLVISTIPHHALIKLLPEEADLSTLDINFEYSTILSVHIKLSENPFKEKFYGLIDSSVHWLFNHDKYITLVTSSASDLDKVDNNSLLKEILHELENYFTVFSSDYVLNCNIIKEKRATFIPSPEIEKKRRRLISPFSNLILAGDWTNTELPATIEGAVQSGFAAANKVIQ